MKPIIDKFLATDQHFGSGIDFDKDILLEQKNLEIDKKDREIS